MEKIIQDLLVDSLGNFDGDSLNWTPAEKMGREEWQRAVERTLLNVRKKTQRPAFGVTETEISVSYHQPVSHFAQLIEAKLGLS